MPSNHSLAYSSQSEMVKPSVSSTSTGTGWGAGGGGGGGTGWGAGGGGGGWSDSAASFASSGGPTANEMKVVKSYNASISRFNGSAVTGSAYAMDAKHAKSGSRIKSRPYHPAKAAYCDLFPDRCFFSPEPETQGMDGGYHSI